MKVKILTIFPEMFPGVLGQSITGKGLSEGLWSLETINIRDFAEDRHKSVDDSPYGGGPGMVMMPEVLGRAIEHAVASCQLPVASEDDSRNSQLTTRNQTSPLLIYPSPRGIPFTQNLARKWVKRDLIILCGRFEGVDQRVLDEYGFLEVSLGDFVLSGGEIAATAMLDAAVRLIPGVVGDEESINEESFGETANYQNLLEYPQYTKPSSWRGREVPEVLLSGNHAKVAQWRLKQAEKLTSEKRPDLWEEYLQNQNKKV